MLDNEIKGILEKLDVDWTTLRLKCTLFEKLYEYNSIENIKNISKRKNKQNRKIKIRSRIW